MTCKHDKGGYCALRKHKEPCYYQYQTDCYYCKVALNTEQYESKETRVDKPL